MQQWAVFAIRNLCENNTENQELIGSTKLEGLPDNQQLKDLGIDASVQVSIMCPIFEVNQMLSVTKAARKFWCLGFCVMKILFSFRTTKYR